MHSLSDLVECLSRLNEPNQGMSFESAHHGKRKYDPDTGRPYITSSRPATLTIYGERALTIMEVIERCDEIAAALRATLNDKDRTK